MFSRGSTRFRGIFGRILQPSPSTSVWCFVVAVVALLVSSQALFDADHLDQMIVERRELLARYEHLRDSFDGYRDLDAERRRTLLPKLERSVVELQQRWRVVRPVPSAVPALRGSDPNLMLVLAEEQPLDE